MTQQSGRWDSRCQCPVPSTVLLVSWRVVVVSRQGRLDNARLVTAQAGPRVRPRRETIAGRGESGYAR